LSFDLKKNGKKRPSAETSKRAKRRSVRKIVDATLNHFNTQEHPKIRAVCKSAGIVDIEQHKIYKYLIDNIRHVIELAGKMDHKKGRATDDLRSLVQSIVLGSLVSPQSPDQQRKIPPRKEQAKMFGLSEQRYKRIVSCVQAKRAALEEKRKGTIYSQVVKRKG